MTNESLLLIAAEVQQILKDLGVESVLIGALAPSIQLIGDLTEVLAGKIHATKDIDTVIRVDSWAAYEEIKSKLEEFGFSRASDGCEHKMVYKSVEVDLIPYGAGIVSNDILVWPKSELTMNMAGISDTLAKSNQIENSDGKQLAVAPLWASVILKVFAYNDRYKRHDSEDLVKMLKGYAGDSERRFQVPEGLTLDTSGAYVCGIDICKYAESGTIKKLVEVLNKQLLNGEYSKMVNDSLSMHSSLETPEDNFQVLQALLRGINDGERT